MPEPTNQAARLIVSAQSVIADLTVQSSEIQRAITSQQALIDALVLVATWEEDPVEPDAEGPEGETP